MIFDCWNSVGINGDGSCPELVRHSHCRNCPTYSTAAGELLANLPTTGSVEERTRYFAQGRDLAERTSESVIVFRVGSEWLALQTSVVLQVTRLTTVHSLPSRRNRVVQGVVNVGGELMVCASLGALLGIEPEDGTAQVARHPERMMVIRHEALRTACPVDEVHGAVRFHSDALRPAPATVTRAVTSFADRLLPWETHSVAVIDTSRLFGALQRSFA
jgi:chemotaxis-related protein WspD